MKFFLLILLLTAVLFESTLIPFPLTIILSILILVLFPEPLFMLGVFASATTLDVLNAGHIGLTPFFIFCSIVLLYVFKNLFDVKNSTILIAFLGVVSYFYARVMFYQPSFLLFILSFIAMAVFVKLPFFYGKNRSRFF